ncbi:MAG: hypothetical protein ACR2QK_02745, partial [Acidimicrobiales bacterium]
MGRRAHPQNSIRRAVYDIALGGPTIAATVLASPVLRGRYNRWGATDDEVGEAMPGDRFVKTPQLGYTRAIT